MNDGGAATLVAAPAAGPAARDTAARLDHAVARLLRRLRPFRAGALTPSQSSMLQTLRDHGPLSLADLAGHEGVRAPTASRAVDLLEQLGLVQRASDPTDGRRQLIDLAGGASSLLAERADGAADALALELSTLAPDDRARIEQALPVLEELGVALGRRHS